MRKEILFKCFLGCQLLRSEPRLKSQEQHGRTKRRGGSQPGGQGPDLHVHPHRHHGQEVQLAHSFRRGLPQTKGLHEGNWGCSRSYKWTLIIDLLKCSSYMYSYYGIINFWNRTKTVFFSFISCYIFTGVWYLVHSNNKCMYLFWSQIFIIHPI